MSEEIYSPLYPTSQAPASFSWKKEVTDYKTIIIVLLLLSGSLLFYLSPRSNRRFIQPKFKVKATNLRRMAKMIAPSTYFQPQSGQNLDSCPYYGEKNGLFLPNTSHPRFIVTGGAGFIGSHLVKRLRQQYESNQIKVLDNLWHGYLGNLQYENGSWALSIIDDFCLVDLRNVAETLRFIRGADVVYHLAGLVIGWNYPSFHEATIFHENILINSNTIYASKVNQIAKFIYTSVAWTHPKVSEKTDDTHGARDFEEFLVNFESSDDWSKLLGENELILSSTDGFEVGILRLHHVYGPNSDYHPATGEIVASLITNALASDTADLVIKGSGEQYQDFIYVGDVIDALIRIQNRGLNQGVIPIGTSKATTRLELANVVRQVAKKQTNRHLNIKLDNAQAAEYDTKTATIERAKRILNWAPTMNLEDGITKTMQWMKENRPRQRILVIAMGQGRGGDLAWKSLHKYLLRPLQAHLAICISDWQSRTLLREMSQYIWSIPDYNMWDPIFEKVAETCNTKDVANKWRNYCQLPGMFMGGIRYCSHPASSGISLAFRWFVQQKIYELNLLNKYDWFILTRSDELYLCNHEPIVSMSPNHILLPIGEYYGGWSDRHIVGKSDVFTKMLNITTELVCRPEHWYPKLRNMHQYINLELLQKFMWDSFNMTVFEFPRSMFVVRAPNDLTRWTQGSNHSDLSQFNLKLKYPQELAQALKHCHIQNLTDTLLRIEQYDWRH